MLTSQHQMKISIPITTKQTQMDNYPMGLHMKQIYGQQIHIWTFISDGETV